jgi:hypothetical protein
MHVARDYKTNKRVSVETVSVPIEVGKCRKKQDDETMVGQMAILQYELCDIP